MKCALCGKTSIDTKIQMTFWAPGPLATGSLRPLMAVALRQARRGSLTDCKFEDRLRSWRGAEEFLDPRWDPPLARLVTTATQQATLHHRSRCLRDFAIDFDGIEWRAVALGVFDIRDLEAHVSEKWLSEPCPMVSLPTEREHRDRAGKSLR